jgi:hypothetical protein
MRSRGAAVTRTVAVAAALACAAGPSALAAARPSAHAHGRCRVPRLTRLTLSEVRVRARRAGCALRLEGARPEQANVQTVQRQSPAAGVRSARVTVWIGRACYGSAAYGPGIQEPAVKPGPTELISGFYIAGGPLVRFSSPGCRRPEPPPQAGTVEVIDPATGAVIATQTSVDGVFVQIPLPAGKYTVRVTFLDATLNGAHPSETLSVSIPAGDSVRQDFVLPVP